MLILEEIEYTKRVIRILKLKDRQYSDKKRKAKEQTMIYKTLHRKLNIEQHKLY